jgi:hypothetical protein
MEKEPKRNCPIQIPTHQKLFPHTIGLTKLGKKEILDAGPVSFVFILI